MLALSQCGLCWKADVATSNVFQTCYIHDADPDLK